MSVLNDYQQFHSAEGRASASLRTDVRVNYSLLVWNCWEDYHTDAASVYQYSPKPSPSLTDARYGSLANCIIMSVLNDYQ